MATYLPGNYSLSIDVSGPSGREGSDTGTLTVYEGGDLFPARDYYQFENNINPTFLVDVGLAEETDTATAFQGLDVSVALGIATETDAANSFGIIDSVNIGQALETNTAYSISYDINVSVGTASETNQALNITDEILPDLEVNIGTATEVSVSYRITSTGGAGAWTVQPDVTTSWTIQS
jgi:hypothetical protein